MFDKERLNLFRTEIHEHNENCGEPVSIRLDVARQATFVVFTIIGIALFALLFIRLPMLESGGGYLTPQQGFIRLIAQRDGIVVSVAAQEGAAVVPKQPIATVNTDANSIDGATALGVRLLDSNKAVQHAQQKYDAVVASHKVRLAQFDAERLQLDQQRFLMDETIAIYAERVLRLKTTLKDHRNLERDGFISKGNLRESELRVLEVEQGLSEKKRELQILVARLQNISTERERLAIALEVERSEVQNSLASAETRRNETTLSGRYVLTTTTAGTLTNLSVNVGDAVLAGQILGSVVPADMPLVAETWVGSAAASKVRKGMKVHVKVNAFPHQTYGVIPGEVISIGTVPATPIDLPFNYKLPEPRIRVRVKLNTQVLKFRGDSFSLPAGSMVSCDFLVEDRRLLDWILSPLRSVPVSIGRQT